MYMYTGYMYLYNCGVGHVCPFFKSTYIIMIFIVTSGVSWVSTKGVWLLVTAFGCAWSFFYSSSHLTCL